MHLYTFFQHYLTTNKLDSYDFFGYLCSDYMLILHYDTMF